MNEHLLVLLTGINLKALKKGQFKINLFKFLSFKEKLMCFINKALLQRS